MLLMKYAIRPTLLEIWKNATKTSAVVGSKKRKATGRRMVEMPNHAIVPKTEEKKATIQNITSNIENVYGIVQ
jgi:hypothetical protein